MAHTYHLRRELANLVADRPFSLTFWDGGELAATRPGPAIAVHSPRAVSHILFARSQLGLARAYVAGDLDIDDLDAVMPLLDGYRPATRGRHAMARLGLAAARAISSPLPPRPPAAELRLPRRARPHSRQRDAAAIRHHYDASNEFFALFLDASLTYSCAVFRDGARSLEEAQEAKHELICRKLALEPGQRVLDIGCGWGAFAIHAARHYDVRVLGVTISERQAALAARRVEEAGLADRVQIRLSDYRDLGTERFDAIASIGMIEHVGGSEVDSYAAAVAGLLRPGGRFLCQGISKLTPGEHRPSEFSQRYLFPDGQLLHVSRMLGAFELAGLENLHAEAFRDDYAETLRHWAERLDGRLDEARRLAGDERTRVWRLYLRTARHAFTDGFASLFQMLTTLPVPAGSQRSRRAQAPGAVASADGAGSDAEASSGSGSGEPQPASVQ